ncbi:tRNA-intron lyase [Candidatus Woesearchaeota archaeon]|nr:tRNA-intron lyase [Candidatus Woesearchaeota archaeon]MCF7901578.1 tRNA-intron lyase [Candidatus Woesearchaeota archaeon]MCF8013982.1 tRNA-intron lyase [Candidatus Woesearchaeota archaeon]
MAPKKISKKSKESLESSSEDTTKSLVKKKVVKKDQEAIAQVELDPKVKEEKQSSRKPPIKSIFSKERIVTENTNEARELYNQSRYGVVLENGQVQLSLHEALYLIEKGKLEVSDARKKSLSFEDYLKKAKRVEPSFWIRYSVFKDMRNRGYIIKTALKFGADFRVYDRGIKPGEDHARWVVYPVHEGSTLTWYEFAAKNRVAHSTKKRLMIAVVDDEADVTYWEIKWIRP